MSSVSNLSASDMATGTVFADFLVEGKMLSIKRTRRGERWQSGPTHEAMARTGEELEIGAHPSSLRQCGIEPLQGVVHPSFVEITARSHDWLALPSPARVEPDLSPASGPAPAFYGDHTEDLVYTVLAKIFDLVS